MNFIGINGQIARAGRPALSADNRGYRYGDGLFETLKMVNDHIVLADYHFERLFAGLHMLKFRIPVSFNQQKLTRQIRLLCKKNGCEQLARVRLSVSRGQGGLYDKTAGLQYLLECQPVPLAANQLNKKGIVIGVFPDAQKSCDRFSNLKSANYLPYVMAAQYAVEKKLDDCLIINTKGNVADATIANLFLLKNKLVITPSLAEGCINGVMRRWLLERLPAAGLDLREGIVTRNDLETFDEAFLTNAIWGVRWVARYGKKTYRNSQTSRIYNECIRPLWTGELSPGK